jgi:hypothetical protein
VQSKPESLIEVTLNVAIGWVTAIITQIIVFPWFGIHVTLGDQLGISVIFTVVSIARSYAIRRWFNRRIKQMATSIAEVTIGK